MDDLFSRLRPANKRTFAKIAVPEWAGADGQPVIVRVRSWDALEKINFQAESSFLREKLRDNDDAMSLWFIRAVLRSIVDNDGRPMFDLPTLAELRKLANDNRLEEGLAIYRRFLNESGAAVDRIYNAVATMNALGQDTEFEIEKN